MNFLSALLYHMLMVPVSRLPFRALYAVSDVVYVFLFHVIRYRRKVVEGNIAGAFPDMPEAERRTVIRKFYRHFCDLLLESFKLFTISEKDLRERIVFENTEVLNQFFEQGRSVILAGGHYNNWEYFAVAFQLNIRHQAASLYKPLANKWFDARMRANRGRYGMKMIPIQEAKAFFRSVQERPAATVFGMDQSPSKVSRSHWMTFLGRDTAVTFGTEKYSRDFNQPVVFGSIGKIKRGYYRIRFTTITDEPANMPHGRIVERAMEMLEADIRREPEWWLWTHRRWKHKRPVTAVQES